MKDTTDSIRVLNEGYDRTQAKTCRGSIHGETQVKEGKKNAPITSERVLNLVPLRVFVPPSWHCRYTSEGLCRLFMGVMGLVLVEPKAVGIGAGVAEVEGSVGNVMSVLDTVVVFP